MPRSHDLKGLVKFLTRKEWSECLDEVFYDHFGPILDAGNMEFKDIAEIIGEVWAMTLWGCAFEDFLTQDFEVEGNNIVNEYLKRRSWKESAQAKAYMIALRTSVMSLYEVSEIVPGKSLFARDLIRGGEPVAVSEGAATKTLKQWDRIAVRIVPLMGKNVFAGCLLPFTPQATDTLFDSLRQIFGKKNARKLPAISDEELQASAPMFTLSWLLDTLERTLGLPSMKNADGDELIFHDVKFQLAIGVAQKDIAAQMSATLGLSQEGAKLWSWFDLKPKHGAHACNVPSFDTVMENGAHVLGNIELKGKFLHLSTNSAERAKTGIALIKQALGDMVLAPLTEIRTVEQMMAERPAHKMEA